MSERGRFGIVRKCDLCHTADVIEEFIERQPKDRRSGLTVEQGLNLIKKSLLITGCDSAEATKEVGNILNDYGVFLYFLLTAEYAICERCSKVPTYVNGGMR